MRGASSRFGGEGRRWTWLRRPEPRPQTLCITAAHCLPRLPPPHSEAEERTYPNLLGRLGANPNVWAECCFVDPVADLAVLQEPDGQELYEEWEVYTGLTDDARPAPLRAARQRENAWLLGRDDGKWFRCQMRGKYYILATWGLYHVLSSHREEELGRPIDLNRRYRSHNS